MAKFDSNRLIFGLFLIILVAIGEVVAEALHIPLWPAFMAMIFFLMAHGDKKTALPILVGGSVGIICLVLTKFFVMGVGPSIGMTVAKLIFILFVVYIIVAFGEMIPMLVNIYTFFFFTHLRYSHQRSQSGNQNGSVFMDWNFAHRRRIIYSRHHGHLQDRNRDRTEESRKGQVTQLPD